MWHELIFFSAELMKIWDKVFSGEATPSCRSTASAVETSQLHLAISNVGFSRLSIYTTINLKKILK